MTKEKLIQNQTSFLMEHLHDLRHDFINYLHCIAMMLQMKKDETAVTNYIDNLAISLKNLSVIYALDHLDYCLSLAEVSLKLINCGFQVDIGDLSPINDSSWQKKDQVSCFEAYYHILNQYIGSIEPEDRLCIINVEEKKDLFLCLQFPYLAQGELITYLQLKSVENSCVNYDVGNGLTISLLMSIR